MDDESRRIDARTYLALEAVCKGAAAQQKALGNTYPSHAWTLTAGCFATRASECLDGVPAIACESTPQPERELSVVVSAFRARVTNAPADVQLVERCCAALLALTERLPAWGMPSEPWDVPRVLCALSSATARIREEIQRRHGADAQVVHATVNLLEGQIRSLISLANNTAPEVGSVHPENVVASSDRKQLRP